MSYHATPNKSSLRPKCQIKLSLHGQGTLEKSRGAILFEISCFSRHLNLFFRFEMYVVMISGGKLKISLCDISIKYF